MKILKGSILIALSMALPLSVIAQKKEKAAAAPKENNELNKEYTTASGLKYKITKKGTGDKPAIGDQVFVHYVGTLTDSAKTKFDSSRDRGEPYGFALGAGQVIRGWDEAIALLHVGDVAILTIPPALGYGDRPAGGGKIPANSILIFEVELMGIKPAPKPWNVKGLKVDSTASGLKYIVIKKGPQGAVQATSGRQVSVNYSGYLGDGSWKLFDSSIPRNKPIDFILGQGMVIKGWDEGIALMRVGDRMRFIIPPGIAYGENGRPPKIPGNATLIFDVELLGVQQ